MQEDLLEFKESEIKRSDKEVFKGFITNPTETFDYIIAQYYNKFVILIMICYGIINNLNRIYTNDQVSTTNIILAILMGGLFGWMGVYIMAFFIAFPGKWLGGNADVGQVVRVFSYSMIPSITSSAVMLLIIIIYHVLGINTSINALDFSTIIYFLFTAISLAGSIWSIVLFVIGISRLQGFTIGKSILNILAGLFFFLLILAIIFIPIYWLSLT